MRKIAAAVLLSASIATPAAATDFYAGAKLGFVDYAYSNITNNDQIGVALFGGYFINERYAVEATYSSLGGFDSSYSTITGSAFGISGVATFPLGQHFSLFGKVGLANTSLEEKAKPGYSGNLTHNNFGLALGFGGQYNMSSTLGLRTGFDIYTVGDSSSSTSSATMVYVGAVSKF